MEATHKRLHGAIDRFNSQMMIPLTPSPCFETKPSGLAGMHGQDAVTGKSGIFHAGHSADDSRDDLFVVDSEVIG